MVLCKFEPRPADALTRLEEKLETSRETLDDAYTALKTKVHRARAKQSGCTEKELNQTNRTTHVHILEYLDNCRSETTSRDSVISDDDTASQCSEIKDSTKQDPRKDSKRRDNDRKEETVSVQSNNEAPMASANEFRIEREPNVHARSANAVSHEHYEQRDKLTSNSGKRARVNEPEEQAVGETTYESIPEASQKKQKTSSNRTAHPISGDDSANVTRCDTRNPRDHDVNQADNSKETSDGDVSSSTGGLRGTNTLNNRRSSLENSPPEYKRENANFRKPSSLWEKKMDISNFRYKFREKEGIINEHFENESIEIDGEKLAGVASGILKCLLQKNGEAQDCAVVLFSEEVDALSPTEFSEGQGPTQTIVKAISQASIKPAKLLVGLTYLMRMGGDDVWTSISELAEACLLRKEEFSFFKNNVLPLCVARTNEKTKAC